MPSVNQYCQVSTQEKMRMELEETRLAFQNLLRSLSESDLHRRVPNLQLFYPKMKIGLLLLHVSWYPKFFPRYVTCVRKGKGFANFPKLIFKLMDLIVPRVMTFKDTRESVAQQYDAAHKIALEALEIVEEHEWDMGAKFHGEYKTLRKIFHFHAEHFAEHAADIKRALG